MSPMRLVIIAGLLYFGYRLLIRDWNIKKNDTGKTQAEELKGESVEDVLVEDPVCHRLVPKQQAIRLKQKGVDGYVYFCSEECCEQFTGQTGEKE